MGKIEHKKREHFPKMDYVRLVIYGSTAQSSNQCLYIMSLACTNCTSVNKTSTLPCAAATLSPGPPGFVFVPCLDRCAKIRIQKQCVNGEELIIFT